MIRLFKECNSLNEFFCIDVMLLLSKFNSVTFFKPTKAFEFIDLISLPTKNNFFKLFNPRKTPLASSIVQEISL